MVAEGVPIKEMIYHDIKPENSSCATTTSTFVDFGLAKKYRNPRHRTARRATWPVTNTRYDSINTHLGKGTSLPAYMFSPLSQGGADDLERRSKEQSRRDGMESLGYLFLYFCRGRLPWKGIETSNLQEHSRQIMGAALPRLARRVLHLP